MLTREAIQQIKDPARNGRWFVLFNNASDPYECIAEQAELVFEEIQPKSRYVAGSQKYYPDNATLSAVSMTFYETYDYQVTRYMNRWRSLIRRDDGFFGLPADYKRVIDAQLYYPNRNSPVLTVRYTGCWPTNQGAFALTYDDEEGRLQVPVTFSVDRVQLI